MDVNDKIIEWAKNRNILNPEGYQKQTLKLEDIYFNKEEREKASKYEKTFNNLKPTNMETKEKVIAWANQRNLLPGDPNKQTLKLISEVGELADAIAKNNHAEIIDAIGDIQVVLIILSNQLGVDYQEALKEAYNVIKSRTGKTVNGVFIKD